MKFSLKTLFFKYKVQISLTFFLLTIEAILLALIPFGIGLSIDSLVNKDFTGIYYLTFILFLILIFSTSRRLYDTRVYSKIYALLATSLVKRHKRKDENHSVIITRTNMVNELVDFFEHDLTEAYTSSISVITALIMIYFFNIYVFLLCVFSTILIFYIYKLSQANIFKENSLLNNEMENRLNIIKNKNIFLVSHFRKIANSMIRLSDIESYNYVLIQIIIAAVLIGSLYIGVVMELSTGNIFAMLTYVMTFSFEVLTLPIIFQQFIRLQEITNRINKG